MATTLSTRRGSRPRRRNAEVLHLAARGLSNAEIAATLHVSEAAVKTHIARMLDQLLLVVANAASRSRVVRRSRLQLPMRTLGAAWPRRPHPHPNQAIPEARGGHPASGSGAPKAETFPRLPGSRLLIRPAYHTQPALQQRRPFPPGASLKPAGARQLARRRAVLASKVAQSMNPG